MAKQCEICKSYYPDELPSCPQCTSRPGSIPSIPPTAPPPKKPAAEDEAGTPTVVGGGPPPAPDTDLAGLPAGAVDLGSPSPLPGGPISGSAVNLGELFKKQQQPEVQVEMPSSQKGSMLAGSSSMLSKGDKSSMLSDQQQGMDVPSESMLAEQQDPETMAAKMGGPPTMVGSSGTPTQLPPKAPPTQLASKATQLATGAAPQTKLAPPGAMEALAKDKPDDPKKTKMAAGAAALTKMAKGAAPETKLGEGRAIQTKLASPEEMQAAMQAPASPKATKMAAGAAAVTKMAKGAAAETKLASTAQSTKLASPEEMEALLRGEDDPKKTKMAGGAAPITKMAAGAAPTTKLAPIDEMEELARGGPKATKMAAGAAPETRLAPLDEMEGDAASAEIEERYDATHEALLAEEEEEPVTAEVAELAAAAPAGPPPKKRSRTIPLLFGMLLGSAAVIALAIFDLLPVDALKDLVGIKKPVENPEQAYNRAFQLIRENGRFDEGLAILKDLPDSAKVNGLRGEARWLKYLRDKDGKNLNKSDGEVVNARQDLEKAGDPYSVYWIADMEYHLTGPDASKKHHQEGLKKYPGPNNEQLFNGGTDRIDRLHGKPGGAQSRVFDLDKEEDVAALAALLMVGFQAPAQPAAPPAQPGEEAG
ncbi:MAG: hypothetical protein AB7K24_27555, partial [Gemmataceae bacterium]